MGLDLQHVQVPAARTIEFKFSGHNETGGVPTVQVWRHGECVAVIYAEERHGGGIRILSPYLDQVLHSASPPPAVIITLNTISATPEMRS
jgi:hypothetical protein